MDDPFGTAGVRGPVADRVTPELALRLGRAAGTHAPGEYAVGRDGRTTGDALASALAAGLQSAGARVVRLGAVPTPALARASVGRRGAMLTASHNPPADNGVKLFVDGVEYDTDAERAVAETLDDDPAPSGWAEWTTAARADVLADYRAAVVEYAAGHGADPGGVHVAVDCGNGAGSLATPQVLTRLGAAVSALNANLDGHFPGRPSKPTEDAVADLRAFVRDSDADVGFAQDGDADRLVVVDADGEVVHEDTVVAVLAHHYVARADDDPVVVTTPNASARIDERVTAAGGRVERVGLGALHEGVAAARTGGEHVAFAAEPWKHSHPDFGGWLDGVVSAAVLTRLVAEAGSVAALRDPVSERPYRKANVECPDGRKAAAMAGVRERLAERLSDAEFDTEYGVRATLADGAWVLVRPSGTEPYIRVYAESDEADVLLADIEAAVREAVAAA